MKDSNIVRLTDEMRAEAEAERAEVATTTSTDGGDSRTVERRPLMREKPDPEPYPVEALLDFAPYARAAQALTQTPAEMAAAAVLAAANHALQAHADVDFSFGPRPISLFLVVSSESGTRKSAVDNLCMRGTYRYQERLLIEAEARGGQEDDLSPVFVTSDPTADAVLAHFAKSIGNLCLCNPEAGSMIGGYAFRQENALGSVAKLSDCWDGKFTVSLRVTSTDRIVHGKRLNATLMGQPDVIARLYSPTAKGQGFTSRLLTCEPTSLIGTRKFRKPNAEDVELMDDFADYVYSILELPMPVAKGTRNVLTPRVVPLSAKAFKRLAAFANDIEHECRPGGRFAPVKEFCAKAPEHASRLAATLALDANFEAKEVRSEFIDAGIELASWYAGEALRISGGADDEADLKDAQRLLDWMQTKERSVFSLVEIYQRANTAARSAAKARKLLDVLTEHGWVVRHDEAVEFDGQLRREAYRLT